MSNGSEKIYHPGEVVPESGIYECNCMHEHQYSTDVKGHIFPPLSESCEGDGWKLKAAAHPN